MASYKRFLLRHEVKTTNGNVFAQDLTEVLTSATSSSIMKRALDDRTEDIMMARKYDFIPAQEDHDYTDCPNFTELSYYKEVAVGYIAGYVVKMVKKIFHVQIACLHLQQESRTVVKVVHCY